MHDTAYPSLRSMDKHLDSGGSIDDFDIMKAFDTAPQHLLAKLSSYGIVGKYWSGLNHF